MDSRVFWKGVGHLQCPDLWSLGMFQQLPPQNRQSLALVIHKVVIGSVESFISLLHFMGVLGPKLTLSSQLRRYGAAASFHFFEIGAVLRFYDIVIDEAGLLS